MSQIPALAQLPPGIVTLADHEAHARTRLEAATWAYLSGGAADEITLRANCDAWDRLQLLPRVLQPLAGGHTRVQLLGRTLAHPMLLAPVAYHRLAHADGELATAHAAAAQQAGLVLSTQASTQLEDVAQAIRHEPDRGPLWFQLYLQADRGFTRELVQRAETAGYEALVLTVDAPVSGARDRERRAGFRLPPGVRAVNLDGLSRSAPVRNGAATLCDGLLQHAPSWDDVAWLQAQTRLPILLKGVLHPDDARQAATLKIAGLVVSNHGGRTLDTTPATAPGRSRAGHTALAGRWRHPARHRCAQGRGPGRQCRHDRPPLSLGPGQRGGPRGGPRASPVARRAGNGHGAVRVPHARPCDTGTVLDRFAATHRAHQRPIYCK